MPVSLSNLIKKGGIFYNVMGNNPKELITNSINLINTPSNLSKEEIIYSLLQREDLMSTGIGKGIAIPHSRNPIIADIENECVALCFSENPIDYDAIDKIPVHSLFFVLSANPKRHLEILSKIVFLCQQEQFVFILDKKPTKESILDFIEKKESEWKK
ncbi:MAG: hypothetical protein A2Y34_04690 [Spirochaetes bacterium GWC1_27_15]|nr:MAG: hypothetical protein A2Z98_11230 [Spirochaetes bacterium GWB1_27_13]OHD24935.1 MAG: hypothetical protein A2Y34_04690 [Spirochaetes bacterium GWC1_27_15]